MRRVVLYLVQLAVLVALGVWLAENPGAVRVDWQGWRVDTSVAVLALGVALVAAAVLFGWRLWRTVVEVPASFLAHRAERRRDKGYQALSLGMAAVAAGDAEEAKRQARRADSLLDEPPLTMLLSAQAAALNGDDSAAARYYSALIERPETAFLGVAGLLSQAKRAGDRVQALALAERAFGLRPDTPMVVRTLFDLQARDRRWTSALRTLEHGERRHVFSADDARRFRATLLVEQAREAEREGNREAAADLAKRAAAAAPGLAPAAVLRARLLIAAGKTRRAIRLVEDAWARQPHPDLAALWREIWREEPPLARMKRFEHLARLAPRHPESRLALAEAALEARLWGEARANLRAVLDAAAGERPGARVCRLMAQLEDAEHGDAGAVRQWLERASMGEPDPAWVCSSCGASDMLWTAICGNCGAFGTLDWRTPPRVSRLLPGPASPAVEPAAAELVADRVVGPTVLEPPEPRATPAAPR